MLTSPARHLSPSPHLQTQAFFVVHELISCQLEVWLNVAALLIPAIHPKGLQMLLPIKKGGESSPESSCLSALTPSNIMTVSSVTLVIWIPL